MNSATDSSNRKEEIILPKPTYFHVLSTHSRPWIENYYKETSVSRTSRNASRDLELSINDKKATEFKLWLEAGKVKPTGFPKNVDLFYNFNMWRNFKKCFLEEDYFENESGKVIEEVAKIYPITLPKPSKLDDNDIIKYTESAKLICDPMKRKIMIENLKLDKLYMDQMKLRTSLRNPPINEKGNINPPQGYKKYDHYFFPQAACTSISREDSSVALDPDVFGRVQKAHFKPSIWKLSTKSKNPAFKEAMDFKHCLMPITKGLT